MKVFNSALVMLSLAAMAAAQAKPAAAPPSQAVAPKPAAAQGAPAASGAARSPFSKPAAAAKGTAKKAAAKPAAAQSAAATTAAAPELARAKAPAAKGRRDPFLSPIVKVSSGPASTCSTGKRCLQVGEMVLRGIVKAQNGMIAVVENSARKTYFLRENDPVFNGFVMKITGDSVIFRENTHDSLGRESSHEVVKKVAPTA